MKRCVIFLLILLVASSHGISFAQTDDTKTEPKYCYSLNKYFREPSYYWIEEANQEHIGDSNLTIQVRTTGGEPLSGLYIYVDTLSRSDISTTRTITFVTDSSGVVVIPKTIRGKCVGYFRVQALPGTIGLKGMMSDNSDMHFDNLVPIKIHVVIGMKKAIGYKILSDIPIPNDVLSEISVSETEKMPKELKKYKKHISIIRFVSVDLNAVYM